MSEAIRDVVQDDDDDDQQSDGTDEWNDRQQQKERPRDRPTGNSQHDDEVVDGNKGRPTRLPCFLERPVHSQGNDKVEGDVEDDEHSEPATSKVQCGVGRQQVPHGSP
jgi:hypothetical protein